MQAKLYMNAASLIEFIKIGMLAGECDKSAADTKKNAKTQQEKTWAKNLKTSATLLNKVVDERMKCLDKKQLDSVERRFNNSQLSVEARYSVRVGAPTDATITVSSDDFVLMAEMMLMGCGGCPQGKYVKDCPYRAMYHRVGIPVGRTEVQDGQCEFMTRNVPKIVMPNGHTDPEARKMFSDEDRELLL